MVGFYMELDDADVGGSGAFTGECLVDIVASPEPSSYLSTLHQLAGSLASPRGSAETSRSFHGGNRRI